MSAVPVVADEAFTLWFRSGRRARWEAVGTAATAALALDMMDGSGRHHGQWLVTPTGNPPEPKPVPR